MKIPRIKKTEPTLFASHIIPVNPIIPNDDIEYRTKGKNTYIFIDRSN